MVTDVKGKKISYFKAFSVRWGAGELVCGVSAVVQHLRWVIE